MDHTMPLADALSDLSKCLGERLSRSKSDLDLHGASETHFAPCPPDAVAYPETTEEVARIVCLPRVTILLDFFDGIGIDSCCLRILKITANTIDLP